MLRDMELTRQAPQSPGHHNMHGRAVSRVYAAAVAVAGAAVVGWVGQRAVHALCCATLAPAAHPSRHVLPVPSASRMHLKIGTINTIMIFLSPETAVDRAQHYHQMYHYKFRTGG